MREGMREDMNKMHLNKGLMIAGLSSFLLACGNGEPPPTGITLIADPQASVATIGDGNLSVAEVRDYLLSRPVAQGQTLSEAVLNERLEEMVTAEVLFQEALRLKLDQQPELRRNLRLLLAQRLLAEKVDKPVLNREIPDEELKAYFEEHRGDYTKPVQFRLADIYIAVEKGISKTEKAQKLERAKDILEQAIVNKGERFGFSTLMKNHSDKHPAYAFGDTGFFGLEGEPTGIDTALTKAAFSLQRNGDIFPEVVTTSLGYHVIMRVGRRDEVEVKYTDLVDDLDQRIRREELALRRSTYVDEIREKADIEIETELITKLVSELQGTVDDNRTPAARNFNTPPVLVPKE
jgi:peptidyl-prolyl cis-trans isomerase C